MMPATAALARRARPQLQATATPIATSAAAGRARGGVRAGRSRAAGTLPTPRTSLRPGSSTRPPRRVRHRRPPRSGRDCDEPHTGEQREDEHRRRSELDADPVECSTVDGRDHQEAAGCAGVPHPVTCAVEKRPGSRPRTRRPRRRRMGPRPVRRLRRAGPSDMPTPHGPRAAGTTQRGRAPP